MLRVKREGIILGKTGLWFENEGVMNPAVIADGDMVHLFYRAVRQGNYSTIGYCRLEGPLTVAVRNETPLIVPEYTYERQGVEDPRIVRLDGCYYLTYTAYDGLNARGRLPFRTIWCILKSGGSLRPISLIRSLRHWWRPMSS